MSHPTIAPADRAPGRTGWLFAFAAFWGMMSMTFINAGHAMLLPRMAETFDWSNAQGGCSWAVYSGVSRSESWPLGRSSTRSGIGCRLSPGSSCSLSAGS